MRLKQDARRNSTETMAVWSWLARSDSTPGGEENLANTDPRLSGGSELKSPPQTNHVWSIILLEAIMLRLDLLR